MEGGKAVLVALVYIIVLPLSKLRSNIREFRQEEEVRREVQEEIELRHFLIEVEAWLESVPQVGPFQEYVSKLN